MKCSILMRYRILLLHLLIIVPLFRSSYVFSQDDSLQGGTVFNHVDPTLPQYEPGDISDLELSSVGSDSMDELVASWVTSYRQLQKKVKIQVVSRGSATAPVALVEGEADLGPMSRPMREEELQKFSAKFGFKPIFVRTAFAAVGVYVTKDNPLGHISVEQLGRIYGASNSELVRQGRAIKRWGDLGVTADYKFNPIRVLGVGADSQIGVYFKQQVLRLQDFNKSVVLKAGAREVQDAILGDRFSLGFAEVSELRDGVKLLSVYGSSHDVNSFEPSVENIYSGHYPLARPLNIYLMREPDEAVEDSLKDFLTFVLSREGQEIVAKQGLIPLSAEVVREELAKLD